MSMNNISYIIESSNVVSIRKSYQRKNDIREYHLQISDDLAQKFKKLNECAIKYNKDHTDLFEALLKLGVDKCIEITQLTINKSETTDNRQRFLAELSEFDTSKNFFSE